MNKDLGWRAGNPTAPGLAPGLGPSDEPTSGIWDLVPGTASLWQGLQFIIAVHEQGPKGRPVRCARCTKSRLFCGRSLWQWIIWLTCGYARSYLVRVAVSRYGTSMGHNTPRDVSWSGVGIHDGADEGGLHSHVPFIGGKTLTVRQKTYNDIHAYYRARVEHLFAGLWSWWVLYFFF